MLSRDEQAVAALRTQLTRRTRDDIVVDCMLGFGMLMLVSCATVIGGLSYPNTIAGSIARFAFGL